MSFGFSIGDFLSLGQLTWSLYRACKSSPSSFLELSRELNSLHTILLELSDEAGSPTSLLNRRGATRKEELDSLVDNLREVLTEIDGILKRYGSLGRDQKKVWERVGFASHNLGELRGRLQIHVGSLQVFMQSLSVGSLGRIEVILDELVRDVRAGRKERSVISCAEEEENADEVAWSELERELVGEGITIHDVRIHKVDIKEYLIKLIQDHTMENEYGTEASSDSGIELKIQQLAQQPPSSDHLNTQNLEIQFILPNSEAVPFITGRTRGAAARAGLSPSTLSSSGLILRTPLDFKPTRISFWKLLKLKSYSYTGQLLCLRSCVMVVLDRHNIQYTPHSTGFHGILPLYQGSSRYNICFYQLLPTTYSIKLDLIDPHEWAPTGLLKALHPNSLGTLLKAHKKNPISCHFPSCRINFDERQE